MRSNLITRLKANRSATLFYKLINTVKDSKEFFTATTTFTQQIVHRMPIFSYGLFVFDFKLAFQVRRFFLWPKNMYIDFSSTHKFQMMSAASIYILIFAQFEISHDEKAFAFKNISQ